MDRARERRIENRGAGSLVPPERSRYRGRKRRARSRRCLGRFALERERLRPTIADCRPFSDGQELAVTGAREPSPVVLSPDGSVLVYKAETDGAPQLFLRRLAEFESRPIPGTVDARGPFFSPDSQWLGFEADGKLQRVSIAGGMPIAITDLSYLTAGASWGQDDSIVFADSWRFRWRPSRSSRWDDRTFCSATPRS